jgi:hypothetical protein
VSAEVVVAVVKNGHFVFVGLNRVAMALDPCVRLVMMEANFTFSGCPFWIMCYLKHYHDFVSQER